MTHSPLDLLKTKRFLPLLVTQFLGAFHDNLFKNALVALLLYTNFIAHSMDVKLLTTLAAAVFILPLVLFSAMGGQLADKYPKDQIIRLIKLVEIIISLFGVLSIMMGSLPLSFVTLFLLGTHSAFFGASKYSILPQHLQPHELVGGNALTNTGTFLAILFGTIMGTSLVLLPHGTIWTSLFIVLCALIGYGASRFIPNAPARDSSIIINWNPFTEMARILKLSFQQTKPIQRSILGMSWFYFMGGMFLSQIPNFTKEALHADGHVLILFLTLFSVGIAAGGFLNHRLLKGQINGTFVPLAALGMSIFSIDLFFATSHATFLNDDQLWGMMGFLSYLPHWRILFDITAVAICGGLYVVPLNALVQHESPDHLRSRILAGSAVLNAMMIVFSALLCAILIGLGFSISAIFLIFALGNLGASLYICALLPDYLFKTMMQIIFKICYRVEVRGADNIAKAGKRAVIVANHVSLMDPPLLAAFLSGKPMFAVNSFVANWWWVRPFLQLVDAFPLDPTNPLSLKSLIRKVQEDRHVVIFPEGRLTETGALMKIYDGTAMVADRTGAKILPVRLDGVQYLPFARLKGKFPVFTFPKIIITILEPQDFIIDPEIKGRARRHAAGQKLFSIMENMMFKTAYAPAPLWQVLQQTAKIQGAKAIIAEDINHRPMTFDRLLIGSMVLGNQFTRFTSARENVGLMLPNTLGCLVSFFALQSIGRVPAMINYSAGISTILSCVQTAQIKNLITSRVFIERGRLEGLIEALEPHLSIIYLEDIQKTITLADKIRAKLTPPALFYKQAQFVPNDPAVVLFTSGSEGNPKGVVLSHANITANIQQLSSRVDFNRQDIVFNALPMFHSFGLTGGALLPVLSGIRTFLYPSPLHYRIVPEMVYRTNATIMFGTNTFLKGYARMADAYDFYRMRYIFAGAERVEDETRRLYLDRFGVKILEGYGATETSPVLAVNSAMHFKAGTVGRLLPAIQTKLEPVAGVVEGAKLLVKGDNVMLGYYLSSAAGIIQPPVDGWHDTGDIVSIDSEGFVKIVGRAKRFAKIGAEMVSLSAVEQLANACWEEDLHAAISTSDPKKGEKIILFTTQKDAKRVALAAYAQQHGINNLSVPSEVIMLEKMPLLGSGKTDYTELQKITEA